MNTSKILKKIGLYNIAKYFYFFFINVTYNFKNKITINYNDVKNENIIIQYQPKHNPEIPKVIWMFWNEISIPKEINYFIDKIKRDNPDYQVNVINFDTLPNYIDDLTFDQHVEIPIANKSDLIRLALLYKYGGIWLDATVILFKPLEWFLTISNIKNYDLIAFYREKSSNNLTRPIIENWFLATPPENEFINKWYCALKPLLTLGAEDYFRAIERRADYLNIVQKITNPTYLLAYLAQQVVFSDSKQNFNLYLRKCEVSAFVIHEALDWNYVNIQRYLAFKDLSKSNLPNIIKVTSGERYYLKLFFDKKLIRKDSVLGYLL